MTIPGTNVFFLPLLLDVVMCARIGDNRGASNQPKQTTCHMITHLVNLFPLHPWNRMIGFNGSWNYKTDV